MKLFKNPNFINVGCLIVFPDDPDLIDIKGNGSAYILWHLFLFLYDMLNLTGADRFCHDYDIFGIRYAK